MTTFAAPGPGLCGRCRHVRRVRSGRGSIFYLCQRSATDPTFRKYPPIPVLRCPGFEPEPVHEGVAGGAEETRDE